MFVVAERRRLWIAVGFDDVSTRSVFSSSSLISVHLLVDVVVVSYFSKVKDNADEQI
jgi:hypothetical protein